MSKLDLKVRKSIKVRNKNGSTSSFTITKCGLNNNDAKKEAAALRKGSDMRFIIKEGENGYCIAKGPKSKVVKKAATSKPRKRRTTNKKA